MPFVPLQSQVLLPAPLHGTFDGADIGMGAENGYVRFFSHFLSKNVIAGREDIYHSFTLITSTGVSLELQAGQINGRAWWSATGGKLYYDGAFGYVYSTGLNAGWTPLEYQDSNNNWQGDAFYHGDVNVNMASNTFAARGSITGQADITISWNTNWPRWESSSQLGEYTAAGGAAGGKNLGNPFWRGFAPGGAYVTFVRSSAQDATGHYRYGDGTRSIAWDTTADKMVYGVYNSPAGWWEADAEFVPGQPLAMSFAYPSGADPIPTGSNMSISFVGWVYGDGTKTNVLIGSLATLVEVPL